MFETFVLSFNFLCNSFLFLLKALSLIFLNFYTSSSFFFTFDPLMLNVKIKILRDAEVLSDYNSRRPNIIPLLTEAEMLFEKESHRVDKLRKLSDKIVSTVSERVLLLNGLKEKVNSRFLSIRFLTYI